MEDVNRQSLVFMSLLEKATSPLMVVNFKEDALRYIVNQPFEVTGTAGQFDVKVNVDGGGVKGQAEAIRLGISRALCEVDKEAYRPALKANGFLTRDAREVERKKPGQPGARRRFQFSKR